jgi:hypothetical protein
MILSGAGLFESSESKPIYQHVTETVDGSKIRKGDNNSIVIRLSNKPYLPTPSADKIGVEGDYAYVMLVKNGEIVSEPYVPTHQELTPQTDAITKETYYELTIEAHDNYNTLDVESEDGTQYNVDEEDGGLLNNATAYDSAIIDYYIEHTDGNSMQIEITPDKFGGNYYLEASTLFRDQNGVDMPAEFIIPNCKIQSNFTFTMASSGDPSTFTFTMDAFPDYTRFDRSKKVLAAIQIIKDASSQALYRTATPHVGTHDIIFG